MYKQLMMGQLTHSFEIDSEINHLMNQQIQTPMKSNQTLLMHVNIQQTNVVAMKNDKQRRNRRYYQ